jgi:hypothetical protein
MTQNIVGSKMPDSVSAQLKAPTDNRQTGYGANGYKGNSSDTDPKGNPTRSALAQNLFPNPGVGADANPGRVLAASGNVPDHPAHAQNRARQSGGVGNLPGAVLPPNHRPVKR